MNVFCPSPATSVWQEACDTSLHTVNRRCATSPRNSPALSPSFLSRSHHFPSIGHTTSTRQNRGACRSRFRCGAQCATPSSSLLLSAFPKSRGRHIGISPNLDIAAAANSGIRHRFYGLSCLASCHGSLAAIPDVIFFDDTTRDLGVMFLALLLALAWVRLFDELARSHLLEQVSRLCMSATHLSQRSKHNLGCLLNCTQLLLHVSGFVCRTGHFSSFILNRVAHKSCVCLHSRTRTLPLRILHIYMFRT